MNIDLSSDLTVVIPTYNRSRFLDRLLTYATEVRFPFRILVADSSNPGERARNEAAVAARAESLAIDYLHVGDGFVGKLSVAVEAIRTRYGCFCADDDFQIPEGLLACLAFLESDASYASCMGGFLGVGGSKGGLEAVLASYPSRDESSAADRVLRWSENFYSGFYAVYRTPALLEMVRLTARASCYERSRIIPEVLMGQMALLLGRQRILPEVSILYQMHPGNDSRVTPCVRDKRAFPADYRHYLGIVSPEAARLTGLSAKEATRVIERSFGNIYRWTGGPGWIFKSAFKILYRPWRKLRFRLDAKRTSPRFSHFTVVPVSADDPRLAARGVKVAMGLLERYPNGLVDPSKTTGAAAATPRASG
jgi:glycosyltransferase domain-containing protein